MLKPLFTKNETQRLSSLLHHDFESLENCDEFDFLTDLAAQVCGCPISLISLIYADKQWFLSNHGLAVKETPRDFAFCAHAIHEPENEFVVENALNDGRFFDNPLVVGEPNIRFYTGIPILDGLGNALGTLCVIDKKPKQLDENQMLTLKKIANQVHRLFELRRYQIEDKRKLIESELNVALLRDSQEFNKIGAWHLNLKSKEVKWTDMVYQIHELEHDFIPNLSNGIQFYHPEDQPHLIEAISKCKNEGDSFSLECRLITHKGRMIWVRSSGKRLGDSLVGSFQDITYIKENELKFKMILNASKSLLVVLDLTGKIIELNKTALELSALPRDKFIGHYFWSCDYWGIPSDFVRDLILKFKKALEGEESSEELTIWLNKETPFTVLFGVKPVYDDYNNLLFIVVECVPIQDVVDERNRNKFTLEGAGVATAYWNFTTKEIQLDERWYENLGYKSLELEPMTPSKFFSFYHPEDKSRCVEIMDKVLLGEQENYEAEARLKHKDGHWIWIHDKGRVLHRSKEGLPITMYGLHQVVTERKEREIKLAYQENILNALFRNSMIGISLNDYHGENYMDVNDSMLGMLGYSKEEFLTLSAKDIVPIEYHEEMFESMKVLLEKHICGPNQRMCLRKDGSTFPSIIQAVLIKDIHGRDLVWTFIQDISKEKEAENEIRKLLGLTQEQNERLTNFARIVSHNLKNHSDGIIGILDLLREQNPELSDNKFLNLFEKSAKNLVQTIKVLTEEKLLNSKLGKLPLEVVNIHDLIEKNSLAVRGDLIRNNYEIHNLVDFNLEVQGVHAYLESIILNLITNAIKYRNPEKSGALKITNGMENGYVVLKFQDDGLGIDLEKHGGELFGMNKTFHENTDSRGLGLFISKNQIEQMGGKIEVESKVGFGTVFRVYLRS